MASPKVVADDLTVGFLGAGRMAQALASGFVASGLVKGDKISASAQGSNNLNIIKELGVHVTNSNSEVVLRSSVIFVAVKPHIVATVLREVAAHVTKDKLIVSVAAGVKIQAMAELLPELARIIRVGPNTPALVGCGASVYSLGGTATAEDDHLVAALLSSVGISEKVPESYQDIATGLAGSGPAYCFMAIEALADGAVKMGMPRQLAQRFAAQTLMGAGKMVLDTKKHPGELKDAVCSPGGTTIAAVHELEKAGFRAALMSAVEASATRSRQLGEQKH